jgi:hypothetical protein
MTTKETNESDTAFRIGIIIDKAYINWTKLKIKI